MHAALRVVSVERGYDPRDFGLIAFGGAGPLHANALGRLIHADPVVIPSTPGVLSAFGFLASDVQNEFAQTYLRILEETEAANLQGQLQSLKDEANEWLDREDISGDVREYDFYADCRYHMQDIQIPCQVALDELRNGYAAACASSSRASTAAATALIWTSPIEIATVRCVGRGARPLTLSRDDSNGASAQDGIDRHEQVVLRRRVDGDAHLRTPPAARRPGHRRAGDASSSRTPPR